MADKIKMFFKKKQESQRQQALHLANTANVNITPLTFCTQNRGKQVLISKDGATVWRLSPGSEEGTVFSSRQVRVDEKVCLRLTYSRRDGISFGFTSQDPSIHVRSLTQHWIMNLSILPDIEKNLSYEVNSAGEVYYSVNDEDRFLLFSGVDVRSPIWAVVKIQGQNVVEFISSTTIQSPVEEERTSEMLQCGQDPAENSTEVGSTQLERKDRVDGTRTSVRDANVTNVTSNVMRRDLDVTKNCMAGQAAGLNRSKEAQFRSTTSFQNENVGTRSMTSCSSQIDDSPSVLPPLSFHSVHGDSLSISSYGCVAERIQPGYKDGDAFSARPIRVDEKVCIRFVKISDWKSNIRYGFSARDPAELMSSVPKWRRKHCVWLLPLPKKFHKKEMIVHYHVNEAGEVCFGVNGEAKSVFFSKIDTTSSLWAMVQFNGVGTAVQFVEPDTQIMKTIERSAEEARMVDETRELSLEDPLPQLMYQGSLVPLSLHTTTGKNIQLSSEFAIRIEGTFSQGYLFSAYPMLPSQTIVIQILSVIASAGRRPGGLAYGLTSCDPAKLRECDLPDDADDLLDRPEYWVVRQHAANGLREGDELAMSLSLDGEVQESRNNSVPITVMHVDHTLKLWAFVDLYETTQRVRMMITYPVESSLGQSVRSAELRQRTPLIQQPNETEWLSETTSEASRITTTVVGRDIGATATTSAAGRDVTMTSSVTSGRANTIADREVDATTSATRRNVNTTSSVAGKPATTVTGRDVGATISATEQDISPTSNVASWRATTAASRDGGATTSLSGRRSSTTSNLTSWRATNVAGGDVGTTTSAAGRHVSPTSDVASWRATTVAGRDVGTTNVTGRPVSTTSNVTSWRATTVAGRDVGATTSVVGRNISTASNTTDRLPTIPADRDVGATNVASRDLNEAPGFTSPLTYSIAEAPHELPPLKFHAVHGPCIRISSDGTVAEQTQSSPREEFECYAFSERPVRINEKVYFRIVEISKDLNASIHYGFTKYDPATRPLWIDSWCVNPDKLFYKKDITFYFYVNSNGEIRLGANGENNALYYRAKIETTSSLWVTLRIRGIGTAIQFVESNATHQLRRPIQSPAEEERVGGTGSAFEGPLPPLIYLGTLIPLTLHTTKGKNVQFRSEFVARIPGSLTACQGYLFSAHPMFPSQTIVIQILSVLAPAGRKPGGLAYGLTSCDPAKLRECDLPNDADDLLDRPEYWVVNSNAAEALRRGDELAITLTQNGEVQESRNNSDPITVMHVDHTLKLWAFVDLYESTERVRMMITQPVETRAQQSRVQAEGPLGSLERPSTSQNPQPSHDTPAVGSQSQELTETECSICFDQQIDCALYKCGHMCACYMCSVQLWKDGGGRCPICRAQIKEVIRIFKS